MLFRRAFAAVLGGILACCTTTVLASEAPDPGATLTVPLSAGAIYPAEYNGDVRALPPIIVPSYFHLWNEFDAPPSQKPPAQSPSGPTQPDTNVALAAMPGTIANFAGLHFNQSFSGSQVGAGFPPDTNGDVGLDYYIQSVNDAWGIYDKTTGALVAGFTENQLWAGAGTGTQCDANNFGDPVVLYDAFADRWILTNFAFGVSGGNPAAPFYQCIAVSKTSDPVAGGWYLYAVRMDTGAVGAPPVNTLNDYGKFGLWTDCLYMGANGFLMPTGTFNGSIFASFDRAALYAGTALSSSNSSIGFISGSSAPYTMIPANLLGTQAASLPAAGTPEYFVVESNTAFAFDVRKFQHGATACGSGSSLSSATSVSQTSYSVPGSNIVPQPGASPPALDSLGERVMSKVQYRKVGSAESLWVVHTTRATTTSTTRPQWAQINVSGGTIVATPVQQQIFAPDTTVYRWMGSIAADQNGNMAIGYSKSSASVFPSIAYAGRLVGDAANTLPQSETSLVDGNGSQVNNCGGAPCHRWGDYASMSIDPLDDCTFWFTSEYYDTQANGNIGNWQTRIGSFKFPDCGVAKLDQTINFTSSAPGGATFGGTPYVVTATATSGLAVTLTIDATATSVCSLSGSSSGSSVSFIGVGTCKVNANQAGDATYNAAPQVQQSFAVGKAAQTINFTSSAPASAKVAGTAYVVTATATSGLAVTLTIDATATSVCSLSGSTSGSSVSFLTVGTCKVNANQAGNSNYNAASQAQQSFAVGKGDQTVNFTSSAPASAKVGGTAYVVTATATSGLAVALTIDATSASVCSLSGSTSGSSVSFLTVGTCKVNANQAGNANYNAASQAQQSFAVGKGDQTVNFTSSAPGSAQVAGTAYVVTATATSGLAVTLSIDATATSVCSISGSSSGSSVSFLTVGTCKVNANQAGNSNYNAAPQVQQSFAVGKGDQTVNFTSSAPGSAQVAGTAYVVTATANSGLAVSLSIDATATSVCSISGSSSGSSVSFLTVGTCKVNANQAGNSNYNAAPQVQQSFAVGKGDQTVNFTSSAPGSAQVAGTAYVVTATATSGLAVALTIDATSAAVCSLSGSTSGSSVSFLTVGTCTINANQAGNSNYNAASQVQQSFAVGKGDQTINFTSSAPAGAKVAGTAYIVTATATSGLAVSLSIDVTATSVCSLSGSTSGSSISFLAVGTCKINANQGGNTNYNAASQVQQSFAVGKGDQTLNFTSSAPGTAKVSGTAYVVTATATSGLTVALTIDATSASVCSLSGNTSGSSVSFLAVGTCTINANQGGNSNYNAASQVQQSFAVGKGDQTVNFTSSAPGSAKVGGTPYVVTATATSALAVALTIDAASASVCSLSGNTSGSSVSFLTVGTCTINANQGGNSNYNTASQVQQSFAVGKGDQTVNVTSSAPAGAKVAGTAYIVTATATSGLPVTLTIDATATSVCSLSGSTSGSSVSFLTVGTCKVNANQAGNANYNAASQAQQSFAVGKGDQTVNFTSSAPAGAKVAGTPYLVTATSTSGLAVTLAIDATTTSVCSLSGSSSGSSVSFLTVGTCKINANQAGDTDYNAASQVQQSFAVAKGDQTVNFTSSAPAGATVGGVAYVVTATSTSGLAVTLSVDATSAAVCSLGGSASGSSVSFIGAGTCAINANQSGNGNYNAAPQAQQSFAVGKADQTIGFTSTAPASATVGGTAYIVTATATSGLAVTLAVHANAASVCQLSGSASGSQVTFLGVGNCRIDANQAGDATYNAAAQQQQTFAVGQGAQTISFDSTAPAPAVAGGPSYQVLASATSGLAVSLSVDATAAAVCQLDGAASGSNVTFIGIGTCTLNANQSGNGDYAAATQVQQSFAVVPGPAAKLLFTTEPGNVVRGDALGTIAVTETDTLGNVIDDNASLVTFKVAACSGNVLIGSATMTHGVATLSTATRFYTVTDPATLKVTAATGALSGDSSGFVVQANADLMFADAFESCRL